MRIPISWLKDFVDIRGLTVEDVARKLTLAGGTIQVRRPRVRNMEERFESRVLPLFRTRGRAVDAFLPELYLHGLAKGDFALALRGLLGDGAALSPKGLMLRRVANQRKLSLSHSEVPMIHRSMGSGLLQRCGKPAYSRPPPSV